MICRTAFDEKMVLIETKLREIYCTMICLKYSIKKVVLDDTNDGKRTTFAEKIVLIERKLRKSVELKFLIVCDDTNNA